jgi:carbohydrate-selective porin OprB
VKRAASTLVVVLGMFLQGPVGAAPSDVSVPQTSGPASGAGMPPIKYSPAEGHIRPPQDVPSWLGAWRRFKEDMEQWYGTRIGLVLDNRYQHILRGENDGRGHNIFWWNLSIDQPVWEGGLLRFKARGSNTQEGGPPNGISRLVGTRLNVDWAAYETDWGYIANLYLEQKFLDNKLMAAVGKITFPNYFDENKIAGWDFFSHSLARNQVFPHKYHTIGALLRYDPLDWMYLQIGTTDAKGIRSETGLNTTFDGDTTLITMGELGIKTKVLNGRAGNYRFDVWHDARTFSRLDGTGTENGVVGAGVSFDQMLTDNAGAFFRCGIDDGDVLTFGRYWSTGGTWTGLLTGDGKDVVGFGVGQGVTSHDYRAAYGATRTETLLETYYKLPLTGYMALELDCQVLLHPGADRDTDTAVIPGVRVQLIF